MQHPLRSIHRTRAAAPGRRFRIAIAGGLATILVLSVAAIPASAGRHRPDDRWNRDRTIHGNLVDVQILVGGRSVPLYESPERGDRRYFEAARDRNYAVHVHNRTGRRIGVLIVVDGLNVVNGKRSGLASGEPMYVLSPWESSTIRGWRTSLDDVRQFVFVDEERSYASRTDQANGDMGWIRVLAFEEQRPVACFPMPEVRARDEILREYESSGDAPRSSEAAPDRDADAPMPAAPPPGSSEAKQRAALPKAQLDAREGRAEPVPGTGWGEHRHDRVREVWFEAMAGASDHIVLRYEYENGLRALGIYASRDRVRERERGEFGFAQPPRW